MQPDIISTAAPPLRAGSCFAFHTGLAVGAGNPEQESGAATSDDGPGTDLLIYATLLWQLPWQPLVPLCLSFLIHVTGRAHSISVSQWTTTLPIVCSPLQSDQTICFLR